VSAVLWSVRQLALYGVSIVAVAAAEIAWGNAGPAGLAGHALLLALAAILGDLVEDALSGVATTVWRWRARVVGLGTATLAAFFVLLLALSNAHLAARAAHGCALVQSVLLIVAGLLGLHLAVLLNALVLVILAVLPGGLPAALAVILFLPALGFFFAFDHAARRLHGRAASASLLWMIAVEAGRLVLPGTLALAVLFAALPPGRAAALPDIEELQRTPMPHLYQWLVLIILVTSGAMVAVSRLFRSDTPADKLLEELVPHMEAEELLEPARADTTAYGGARERVIRAYVGVVGRARDAGCEIPPHLAPREIEQRVREGAPMSELTALFRAARYGPEAPAGTGVSAAEHTARIVTAALARRRPSRRGR